MSNVTVYPIDRRPRGYREPHEGKWRPSDPEPYYPSNPAKLYPLETLKKLYPVDDWHEQLMKAYQPKPLIEHPPEAEPLVDDSEQNVAADNGPAMDLRRDFTDWVERDLRADLGEWPGYFHCDDFRP